MALNGPDALTSPGYAKDYDEVRRLGSATSTERTSRQTAIALFFVPNAVVTYRDALCRYLDEEPLGLLATTRLFARIDVAVATTFIEAWRLKFDVGFWRPFQAIAGAATDGNDATKAEVGWAPLVPNPTYSDYTSGHAAGTSPFAEVVRRTLGDDVPLVLRAVPDADHRCRGRAELRHVDRAGARCPARADLGRAALPRRHAGRLPPGAHHGPQGDEGAALTDRPILRARDLASETPSRRRYLADETRA